MFTDYLLRHLTSEPSQQQSSVFSGELMTESCFSVLQLATNFPQGRPPRIFDRSRAATLSFVQVLTAMHAQSFAILAARDFQRQSQQHLLAQNILEQNAVALIIADFGLRVGHRQFVPTRIGAERTIKQFKLTTYILRHRFHTAGAFQLQPCRQPSAQAYVFNYLMLAVMLFDDLGMPGRLQRREL